MASQILYHGNKGHRSPLDMTGIKKHKRYEPRVKNIIYGSVSPVNVSALKTDRVINFDFRTSGTDFWRFPVNPVFIRFKLTVDNKKKLPAPGQGDTDGRSELQRQPYASIKKGQAQGVYLDPAMGGSCFFSSVELNIDRCKIPLEQAFQNVYQTMNRKFSSKATRDFHYGQGLDMLVPTIKPIEDVLYVAAMNALDSGSVDPKNALSVGLRCSFDGIFLLSAPKNLTLASREDLAQGNVYGFLPKSTALNFRFTKADPIHKNLGWALAEKGSYLNKTAISAAANTFPHMKIEIEEMSILFEAYSFEKTDLELFPSFGKPQRYVFDTFHTALSNLTQTTRTSTNSFILPAGAKIAYICFFYQFQLYFDANQKKGTSYRSQFPANLERLTLKIDERPVLWPFGLTDIVGNRAAYGSPGALALYQYLVDNNLYDRPFGAMFPKTSEGEAGDQCIPLCLDNLGIKDNSVLTVETEFGPGLSPAASTFVSCVCVTEKSVVKLKDVWSLENVVP